MGVTGCAKDFQGVSRGIPGTSGASQEVLRECFIGFLEIPEVFKGFQGFEICIISFDL